jgi:hypothetical protein
MVNCDDSKINEINLRVCTRFYEQPLSYSRFSEPSLNDDMAVFFTGKLRENEILHPNGITFRGRTARNGRAMTIDLSKLKWR